MTWGDKSWQQAARDYRVDKPSAQVAFLRRHDEQDGIRPPAFSDDALALRFIDQHKDELRYVPSLGKWLRWDGKRWCFDERLIAHDRMRKVCRAAALNATTSRSPN